MFRVTPRRGRRSWLWLRLDFIITFVGLLARQFRCLESYEESAISSDGRVWLPFIRLRRLFCSSSSVDAIDYHGLHNGWHDRRCLYTDHSSHRWNCAFQLERFLRFLTACPCTQR